MLLVLAVLAFTALGLWQVRRMHWKHELAERVESRVHAAPAPLPPSAWLARTAPAAWEYRRVELEGRYDGVRAALVKALTVRGAGYWAMTPMHLTDGRTVWINRGFVPQGTGLPRLRRDTPATRVRIVGLLRATEPGGSLLQANRPADDRWYSRDVAALSVSRHMATPLPIFIDVQREAGSAPRAGTPVPGLTVLRFANNHLAYALTWFAMAALAALAIGLVWKRSARTLR